MKGLSLFLLAVCFIGCAGFNVRPPGGPSISTGNTPYPKRGADTRTVARGASGMETRRFCRSSIPSGWIAVDYLPDSGCAATSKAVAARPVALAVDYSRLTSGAELEVCALERTPSGWYETEWLESDGRCADDANDDPQSRTVKRIRKQ
jgi:hypothetical protein